jgi:hypothetical protein
MDNSLMELLKSLPGLLRKEPRLQMDAGAEHATEPEDELELDEPDVDEAAKEQAIIIIIGKPEDNDETEA